MRMEISQAKRKLCHEYEVDYLVLHRTPHAGLSARSTTSLRTVVTMPYRLSTWQVVGWTSLMFRSNAPGPVITVSIEPTIDFNERSGMASSTRRKAIDLWGPRLPQNNPNKLAKILFSYDNPPGTTYISGWKDPIGIVFPGLNLPITKGNIGQSGLKRFTMKWSAVHRTIPLPGSSRPARP